MTDLGGGGVIFEGVIFEGLYTGGYYCKTLNKKPLINGTCVENILMEHRTG